MRLVRLRRPAVVWAVGLLASIACGNDGEQQGVAQASEDDSASDAPSASNSDPVLGDDDLPPADDSEVPDRVPPPAPTEDDLWTQRDLALEVRFIDVAADSVYWVEHSGLGWFTSVEGDPNDARMLLGPTLTVPETDQLGLLHVELAPPRDDSPGKLYYSTGARIVERELEQDEFESWEPGIFAGDIAIAEPYLYVTNKCIDLRRTSVFPEVRGQPTYERQWSVVPGTEIRCGADNSCSWGALWVNEDGGLCAGADGIRRFDQDLSTVEMLVPTNGEPVALCVFDDEMYWLEGVQGRVSQNPSAESDVTIHRAALDGTGAELVATGKAGYVGQYRCDPDRRQILWVNNSDAAFRGEAGPASVEVFDVVQATVDSAIEANLAIRALAVHERYLFWSEQAALKRIERE